MYIRPKRNSHGWRRRRIEMNANYTHELLLYWVHREKERKIDRRKGRMGELWFCFLFVFISFCLSTCVMRITVCCGFACYLKHKKIALKSKTFHVSFMNLIVFFIYSARACCSCHRSIYYVYGGRLNVPKEQPKSGPNQLFIGQKCSKQTLSAGFCFLNHFIEFFFFFCKYFLLFL